MSISYDFFSVKILDHKGKSSDGQLFDNLPYPETATEKHIENLEKQIDYLQEMNFELLKFKDLVFNALEIKAEQELVIFSKDYVENQIRRHLEHKKINLDLVPKKSDSGYIYVLVSDERLYKIGKTIRYPEYRLLEVLREEKLKRNNFSCSLVAYAATKEFSKMERFFHRIFKEKKVYGEWFNLDNHDIDQIKTILKEWSI